MQKEIGILMAVSSLDNEYSIGSFGRAAKSFIDFLYLNNFTWWQVLPLCIPDEFNSPYSSASIYSLNPFYIDLELLYMEGLISYDELLNERTPNTGKCNCDKLMKTRYYVLYKAYTRNKEYKEINDFLSRYPHIKEFCQFQAHIQSGYKYIPVLHESRFLEETLFKFWAFTQYKAHRQLENLIIYAQQHNVKLMGDLPLYSSINSSEFYFYSNYYMVDEYKKPLFLSGARPDVFSATGQCWGHPIYNWSEIKKTIIYFGLIGFLICQIFLMEYAWIILEDLKVIGPFLLNLGIL